MDLTALFCPKSVAIIGASETPEKVGAIVLKNIIDSGFKGQIYPINPKLQKIGNLPCFADIKTLPEVPELAIIAIPTLLALEVMVQIGEAGIKNVVIYTAGFKEVGDEGAKLEKQLLEIAQKYQLNVLGPNCFGYVNNDCPINTTFGETYSQTGNLRFISQSGAIAASLFDWCKSQQLGFSDFITLGNKAVVTENDVLRYFQKSESRAPIGMYLESIANGPEFLKVTSEITKTIPVFIIKPGKTQAAATAMKSHTGSIAGSDSILEVALKEAGVIRAQTMEDFFDLSRAFSWSKFPEGPKVAIISNAGGPAVICADAASEAGMELVHFDEATRQKLLDVLPRSASIQNPIDLLGDALADRFAAASEIILQTNNIDSLVVILTPQIMTQIAQTAEALGKLPKKYQKPIFCSFIGGTLVAEGEQKLNEYQIPSFRFPERAIAAIGAMWEFRKRQLTVGSRLPTSEVTELSDEISTQVEKIIESAVKAEQPALDNLAANNVLSLAGIPTPPTSTVTSLSDASQLATKIGYPVVLKLSSPGLLHKRKIGGVIVNINNEGQLESAWSELTRKISSLDDDIKENVGIQIQKEVVSGVEVIIGVKRDPTFGPVLLFGAGGSLAELVADRNLHLLPIDRSHAENLVKGSKVWSLLKESEGVPAHALEKLYDVLVRLSQLIAIMPEVTDIEINPVIVTLNDVWAVDGKVILQPRQIVGPKFKTATVISHVVEANKYHYFELETVEPFSFQPGQYVSVKVASDRINCYSIAGTTASNRFNLLVDTSPGGPGSKFFAALKASDKLAFLGPLGTFTLKPEDGASKLLFVATGSGLAPLKCQIEAVLKSNPEQSVTLFLGLNSSTEVFLKDWFEKMVSTYQNFKYRIVVNKPEVTWKGDTGFVTEYVARDLQDVKNCAVYLCGNKNMIAAVSQVMLDHGCQAARIYTEKY
ncbi:MAG: acetate--CoA ligase family protein [candidate division WWE3 bacterium]|nr:acetate--CoA ligase family protein [candidate division WWE3 bacterium]